MDHFLFLRQPLNRYCYRDNRFWRWLFLKLVYYKNCQLQTQSSQKLQRFRTCRKNKKCSFSRTFRIYKFFGMKNEGVSHLKNCWPRLKKVVKSTAFALNRPPLYTPMSLKLATFYKILISKFQPQFRFRPPNFDFDPQISISTFPISTHYYKWRLSKNMYKSRKN
jgi:hypothetical protein